MLKSNNMIWEAQINIINVYINYIFNKNSYKLKKLSSKDISPKEIVWINIGTSLSSNKHDKRIYEYIRYAKS